MLSVCALTSQIRLSVPCAQTPECLLAWERVKQGRVQWGFSQGLVVILRDDNGFYVTFELSIEWDLVSKFLNIHNVFE